MTRHLVALAVAVAVATSPLILDLCAGSCEAAHKASRVGAAPACHHAASPATRLETMPVGCGHDHHGASMAAARDSRVAVQTVGGAVFESSELSSAPGA